MEAEREVSMMTNEQMTVPVTLLTAKTGRITARKSNRADNKLPAIGKKTGKIMERTPARTGRNMGKITTGDIVAGIMADLPTQPGESPPGW